MSFKEKLVLQLDWAYIVLDACRREALWRWACSLPQVYWWCNVFVLSVVMFVIQSAICHVFSVSKQSVDWSGTSVRHPSITYVFTMNLKCSACIFHSEQCMVQDVCRLSITILFSYGCPNALDGICVLNGHYCNWSLYNYTKTQAVKSLANQGWIWVSYQQLGSQAAGYIWFSEIPRENVNDKCYSCQLACSVVLPDLGHEVLKCLCGAVSMSGMAV